MITKEPTPLNIKDLDLVSTQGSKISMLLFSKGKKSSSFKFDNEFHIINCIRAGLPKQAIHGILDNTAISRTQLAAILHISTRQLNRYTDEDLLSAEQSNFLYELSRLYVRATDVLGNKATADTWLHRQNTALNDKTPIEMLDTIEGFRMIYDLLSQIEYGFFS